MELLVVLYTDEDEVWIAECPALPGCVSQGDTRDEAIENVCEAIEICLEVWAERRRSGKVQLLDVKIGEASPADYTATATGRLELAQDLWDGMDPALTDLPLTPEIEALLVERLAEHERDPDAGEPWEVVRMEIERRLRGERADADA